MGRAPYTTPGRFISSLSSQLIRNVAGADHRRGCNLDINSFRENPYAQIEMCLPYATHPHIHDY